MAESTAVGAEALAQRNRELAILNEIARALNRPADLKTALETALARVAEVFQVETGWIWLLREEDGASYLAAALNLPPALAENPRRMEGGCYCLDAYRQGGLRGAANISVIACSRLKKLVEGTAGLRYHASVPLWAQEKKIGMLNVVSADWRKLSADDLRLLHTIGDLLGIAVERARLFERSVQLGAVEERNRLARELHDTLGQGLAAMLMQLEAIDALLEGGQVQRGRQAVGQTLEMARQALEEVRRSVLDLRAAPLEGRSLGEALEKLAREVASREGLKVRLRVTGGSKPLPMRLEAGLYRMAQEALNNAVRHARAKKVQVELVAGPGQVKLSVADDGQGFDPERLPQDRYGLVGLGERARLLEGRLKIESRPGKGTRLEVVVPLEAGHGR